MNDMAGGSKPELSAVLHAASVLEGHVESRLSAAGLSLAKLAALQQLSLAGESLPLGQLAGRLSCVKSNVTQLVDRLEADGLVMRAPDPNDRRGKLAVMTKAGRAAFAKGIRIHADAERELFASLSADEAGQLSSIIEKLRARPGG
jgi:DNA-binding MarR family transcriptional regulator